jgi:exopolyphosphatase/guanosine-5'-triphosphate,3'-diphosphate pyrophosphatase
LLGWAADLHETGLSVAHSQYHQHSGYLVEHSDMTGFTRQEQLFLASLVRHHRRQIPGDYTDLLPTRLHEPLRMTLFCLRFACILCRSRDSQALPEFRLSGNDNRITVMFASDWAEKHPLTLFDLRQEVKTLAPIGINLRIQLRPA